MPAHQDADILDEIALAHRRAEAIGRNTLDALKAQRPPPSVKPDFERLISYF